MTVSCVILSIGFKFLPSKVAGRFHLSPEPGSALRTSRRPRAAALGTRRRIRRCLAPMSAMNWRGSRSERWEPATPGRVLYPDRRGGQGTPRRRTCGSSAGRQPRDQGDRREQHQRRCCRQDQRQTEIRLRVCAGNCLFGQRAEEADVQEQHQQPEGQCPAPADQGHTGSVHPPQGEQQSDRDEPP